VDFFCCLVADKNKLKLYQTSNSKPTVWNYKRK
jgi:hypothetical protein